MQYKRTKRKLIKLRTPEYSTNFYVYEDSNPSEHSFQKFRAHQNIFHSFWKKRKSSKGYKIPPRQLNLWLQPEKNEREINFRKKARGGGIFERNHRRYDSAIISREVGDFLHVLQKGCNVPTLSTTNWKQTVKVLTSAGLRIREKCSG